MPTVQRPKRVNIKVTEEVKTLAANIASAMSTSKVKWTETDVFEQGVRALAATKEVRKALADASLRAPAES